jgi:WD40 repeat protein
MQKEKICPYPGLRPFNEEESIFFKGREEHIDKIISQLQEKKFLMVTGASGDGKSSIIYAGLIPRSRAGFFKTRFNNWLIVDFRPERSPLRNLASALNNTLEFNDVDTLTDELSYGFSSLVKIYKESKCYVDTNSDSFKNNSEDKKQELKNSGANLLILVDQFEELFTNSENFSNGKPSLEAITLINLIIETTKLAEKENLPVYIVCTMRSDYIGDCAAFKGLPELIVYSQFFVPRLKRQEIHRAILEPAKLSGNKIANRLIERLINELGDGLDQLPILQHALNRIWKVHVDDGAPEMDIIHYAKVGGLDGSLLPDDQKAVFMNWYAQQPLFKQKILEVASLTNVLNAHARELFETAVDYCRRHINRDISKEEAQNILQKIFTCLTKINDGRAVRNRSSVHEIKHIIGGKLDNGLIEGLVNPYREPENTLLKPFITDVAETQILKDSDILDITHESLIRNWTELVSWTKQEYENTLVFNDFKKQVERWEQQGRSTDYLLTIGSLSYFKTWYETVKPNPHLIAKYESSDLDPAQKLEIATRFIAAASDYIQLSEAAIKRKRRTVITITTLVVLVLLGFTYLAYTERNVALIQQQIANQKTAEAKESEQLALNSEHDALFAKNSALLLKDKAEKSEKIALTAKQQAELSKQEALSAKAIAESEKRNAQEQRDVAKSEKANAEQEKIKAEQEKIKAETAELKSRKLKLLSIAQNLALKSALYKKNKELGGQLAAQAYVFHKNNGGAAEDPVIYEGLRNAYALLDSNKHSIITGIPVETRSFAEIQGQIISVGIDGKIYKQDCINAVAKPLAQIKYISPINTLLFDWSGAFLVTGHDNFSVCVWSTKDILNNNEGKIAEYKELKGHKGIIRAALFTTDASRLITAGKDSTIIIWNMEEQKPVQEKILKSSAAIRSIALVNENEFVSAQEDGKIVLWNRITGKEKILFDHPSSKPLCLGFNKTKKSLIAGFSDGTLKLFDLSGTTTFPLKYKELKAHSTAIELIAFNKDFSLVATAASDKTIKLYNYSTFFEGSNSAGGSTELKNHNSKVKSIIFTNDNKLIAGCADKTVRIWETSSKKLVENICRLLKTSISETDWKLIVGEDIPYEQACKSL